MNNSEAWQELFRNYDILNQIEAKGRFEISADQIRKYREPRIMTKFDHKINLPVIFSKNELAILPVTRGDYVIAHFDAYHRLEQNAAKPIRASLPENIQSLDCNNIQSEAIALSCAYAAGIIADFLKDASVIPTISGRMGTGIFSFNIKGTQGKPLQPVKISNAQMEIDAAYEGHSCLAIFEAKRELSEDFIVRQIYYPFRVWKTRITKTIRPIFFTYSNNIFSLYEYTFDEPESYSSIRLVRHENYSIEDTDITTQDVMDILHRVRTTTEPEGIPFPQADTFERVINLCELLGKHELSKQNITEEYSFNERQADYYANAGRYLGLIDKNGKATYSISRTGRNILRMSWKNRQLALCECILSHKIFHATLILYFRTGQMPSINDITKIIQHSELSRPISGDTQHRRSKTIQSWLNWIVGLITE